MDLESRTESVTRPGGVAKQIPGCGPFNWPRHRLPAWWQIRTVWVYFFFFKVDSTSGMEPAVGLELATLS